MAVPGLALAEHLAGRDVQGREESACAVADVVVGDALHVAQAHRQQRLCSVEGLDLPLLVGTRHHWLGGRFEVEAEEEANCLDQDGVGGELECLLVVRLY